MSLIAGLFTVAVLKVAVVQIAGGTMFGYSIGYVGVYDTLSSTNENCTQLTTADACGSVKFTTCEWSGRVCQFSGLNCTSFDEGACGHHDECSFDYDDHMCKPVLGFSAVKTGVFAGAMTIGGMLGSFFGNGAIQFLGRKKTIAAAGLFCLLSSIFLHIARATNLYALLILGRIIVGLSGGLACIACPMYVEEMAPEGFRRPLGTLFQVFCTLGIWLSAAVGLAVIPRDFSIVQNNELRIQLFNGVQTLLSVLCFAVGMLIPESVRAAEESADQENEGLISDESDAPRFSNMVGPLTIAFFLCIAQQMTGINAIMTYAPTITKAMGLTPIMGNFVVMLWNFVTTLLAIPVASRFTMRQMYVSGVGVAAVALFIAGIPVYPGLVAAATRHVLAGLGIFLFILAFEVGMGPAFYVLAQELFPHSFRSKGSSFTITTQFIFNIIINICFPIAVSDLSGGPSGNQDKGMSIVFIFFGVCAAVSFIILAKFLHSFKEPASGFVHSTEDDGVQGRKQ